VPTSASCRSLILADREHLLCHLPAKAFWGAEVAPRLVGDDAELYRRFLADGRLKPIHLAPLGERPIGAWLAKAAVALKAGFSREEVALAAFRPSGHYWGDQSEFWRSWLEAFTALATNSDPILREVGVIGRAEAERRIAEARREERREAVYGED
jgi:hypothetical protein